MLSSGLCLDPLNIKTKNSDQKNVCKLCLKSFSRVSTLNTHFLTHIANRSTKCSHCKKFFIDLKLHMVRHTDEKPHKCKHCEKSYARLSNLRRHNINHKQNRENKKIEHICKICSKSFTSEKYFKIHLATHNITNRSEKCPICNNMFIHIKLHMSRHSENQHKCSQCGKSFSTIGSFKKHTLIHRGGEKEHICKICWL